MAQQPTSNDILVALARRFSPPVWALLPQVRNQTGFGYHSGYADAIALNLWPSRGLELHGFEVKIRRGDWLRELKKPQKAEEFVKFCDRWWVVAPKGVVELSELPPTWGHMVFKGGRLYEERGAPKLDAQPLDRLFIAAVFRRAQMVVATNEHVEARARAAYKRGHEEGKEEAERRLVRELGNARGAKEILDRFEREIGVRLETWNLSEHLAAVKTALVLHDTERRFGNTRASIECIRDLCEETLERMEALRAPAETSQASAV